MSRFNTRNETHERISRWTASSGLQYHTLPSHTGGGVSRSTGPGDIRGSYTAIIRTRGLKQMRAQKDTPQEDPETSKSDNVDCSDDENYWRVAPFGPGEDTGAGYVQRCD